MIHFRERFCLMESPLLKYLMNFYRKVDRIEESFDLINSKPKPLAAYLFSNNKKIKDEFVIKISTGGICINDIAIHLVIPSLPFGGVGESGMGAYHGKFSFDAFSHRRLLLVAAFGQSLKLCLDCLRKNMINQRHLRPQILHSAR